MHDDNPGPIGYGPGPVGYGPGPAPTEPPSVGQPVQTPYQHPAPYHYGPGPYGSVAPPGLPIGLKAMAVTISVLKAIPLLLFGVVLIFIGTAFTALSTQIDEADSGIVGIFAGAFAVVVVIFFIIMGISSALLIAQLITAVRNQRTGLLISAGVLSAIDLLFLFGSIAIYVEARSSPIPGEAGDAAGGIVIMLAMSAAQIAVFVWALRSRLD